MSRSGRSYTNVAILVRTPNPTVEGVFAGSTSPSAGALTGDVLDAAALAGATSPASGALAADVTLPFRPPALVVSLRPPPPRPNFMTLVRAPQQAPPVTGALAVATSPASGALTGDVIDSGALAGSTSPAVGALTGDVIDSGALAGTTSPGVGALTGDAAQPTRPATVLVVSTPRPAAYNTTGGLLTVGPVAVSDIDGTLAAATSPASGALAGDVIAAAALAAATSPASGALTGDAAQPSRPSTVLVVSSPPPVARRPRGLRLAVSVPTEVSGNVTGALAGTTSPASGALAGTVATPPRPAAVLVVSVARPSAYAFTGALLTVGPVAPDTATTGALAGVTSPAVAALAGDVADSGALAGATSPASAALTGDVTRLGPSPVVVTAQPSPRRTYVTTTLVRTVQPSIATGALAAATSPAAGALVGDVIDPGVLAGTTSPVSAALTTSSTITGALAGVTSPSVGAFTATSYYPGVLAAATSPTVGALAGAVIDSAALAGLTSPAVGALLGTVTTTGALAGTTPTLTAELNRAPVVHYPLRAGTPADHVTRYQAGAAVDNAAHYYLTGDPS